MRFKEDIGETSHHERIRRPAKPLTPRQTDHSNPPRPLGRAQEDVFSDQPIGTLEAGQVATTYRPKRPSNTRSEMGLA